MCKSLRSVFVCTIASICTSSQISNSAQTNRDKITPKLPELSLNLVFSGHAAHSVGSGSVSTPCLLNGDERKVD